MLSYLLPLCFVLALGLVVFSLVRRGLQMKALAQQGTLTRGRIVKKERRRVGKNRKSPALTYEFLDAFGTAHRRSIHVTESVYAQYEEGSEIEIVYLMDKPQVNGAKYMVDLSRSALNKGQPSSG